MITQILSSISGDGIITLLGTITAIGVSIFTFRTIHKYNRQLEISNMVDKILDVAIQYPHFEDQDFTNSWSRKSKDVEQLRYDLYCCKIFNLINTLWIFCKENKQKMAKIVAYRELMEWHKSWWGQNRDLNSKGYGTKFCTFIENEFKLMLPPVEEE